MEPFPLNLHEVRKLNGKPELYKGWTVWHYKLKCQQTGSTHFEWLDVALAVRNGEIITGCVFQQIDEKE